MVTPFAWSKPHPVNEHVAGAAEELRARGHEVVVLAPSARAADLTAGRKALRRLARDGTPLPPFVALAPAIQVTRRSQVSIPMTARANLSLALSAESFDVVHVHEPGIPSLSYLALRTAETLTVATFHSTERLAYPPGKRQREKLLARVDALTATNDAVLEAAQLRWPGDFRRIPLGVDTDLFKPAKARKRFALEWRPDEEARAAAAIGALAELPGWELVVLRTRALTGRPRVPRALRSRVKVARAIDPGARAREIAGAAGFAAALGGSGRPRLEAAAAGVPAIDPPGAAGQPELVAAAMARLAEDETWREKQSAAARRHAERESFTALADTLERQVYRGVVARRRARPAPAEPLADRPQIVVDLHMHTDHSHDCSIPAGELLDHAEAIGLGGIAITDHNVFAGAQEAVELARGRDLIVIPGEEVMTPSGEVIGLFLKEEIPRDMPMDVTVQAIREQGGIVYMPHPFDRLHSIPDPRTLHRLLENVDVFEVYNARLLLDAYNDEALRFARKYNLLMGAGSDAHVLQGLGTGALRMRAFDGPEEFLISLRSAEVLRRPKSLAYLQGLKWMAQAREKRTKSAAAAKRG